MTFPKHKKKPFFRFKKIAELTDTFSHAQTARLVIRHIDIHRDKWKKDKWTSGQRYKCAREW